MIRHYYSLLLKANNALIPVQLQDAYSRYPSTNISTALLQYCIVENFGRENFSEFATNLPQRFIYQLLVASEKIYYGWT